MSATGQAIVRWQNYNCCLGRRLPTTEELASFVAWEDDQRRACAAATEALNHGQGGGTPSLNPQVCRPQGQLSGGES